jgi:hypothetical protein
VICTGETYKKSEPARKGSDKYVANPRQYREALNLSQAQINNNDFKYLNA